MDSMNIWKELNQYIIKQKQGTPESCQKIFHGPSGAISGLETLHIHRMANLLFVITYRRLPGEELSELIEILSENFPGHYLRIQERGNGLATDLYASEAMPEHLTIKEENLTFYIHPRRGQNIGFFPDMVNGRKAVRDHLNKLILPGRVLNLFSYTCAFSVTALKAGALRVDNWDMNRTSLKIGKENHILNSLDPRNKTSRYFPYDIFKSLGKIRRNGPYDLVIMDPPPFHGSHFLYRKDYPGLIRRLPEWLNKGGASLLCLNASDCSWEEFEQIIKDSLPGHFNKWEKIRVPDKYVGRIADRGLKTFLLTGWESRDSVNPVSTLEH